MAVKKYQVWECKIVVPADVNLPSGFDFPPRMAAQQAVLDAGIEIVEVLSGWGGTLYRTELEIVEEDDAQYT